MNASQTEPVHTDEKLRAFLEANRSDIVDYVEESQRQIPINSRVYTKLVTELFSDFRLSKDGIVPVIDKAHVELAIAICEALWCGWLSQAKANRGIYGDYPERFKQAIITAFEIGQQYAATRK
jgi:hypothetical protein